MIAFLICLALCVHASAQLNQNCVVSVLNRDVQVNADGTWVLPNIPANFGPVRARATCVTNGITQFGQSKFFTISPNASTDVPPIVLGSTTPIPTAIIITALTTTLTQVGMGLQLATSATYADGTAKDVTTAASGTQYTISNPAIATVTGDGLVTAVSSGTVVIQAVNEGRPGIITIQVLIAGATHGGIPDSWAIANGLDPNDPAMPFEDPDHDGLTNLQEFQNGTDPHNPDTDGDGLTDGQELLLYHTNPLLLSTDGTGISDGIEVETGTLGDTLAAKLAAALKSIEVQPSTFVLNVNTLQGTAARQLSVLGHLIDGKTTLNLTSTQEGTNYSSSDLTICNFGTPDGNVLAGSNGICSITAANSGFTAQAEGIVRSFSPTDLSFVSIPGFANSVDVNGNFAYVAAGSAGLQVVDVSDRSNPAIAGSLALPGNANDVRLLGNRAYVAAGSAGLHVIDISNPLTPVKLGTLGTGANALDVAVRGTTAYIADGSNLFLADVTNPAAPTQISALPLTGLVQGVDVDTQRKLAVVTAGTTGIYVIDISNPAAPAVLGSVSTGDARDVQIRGNIAFVADFQNSTTSVDITTPSAPVVVSHITDPNIGGFLQDIVLSGNFALAADVKFVNGIPITDISNPASLVARTILNFTQRDDNGMGIAADGTYVYLAADRNSLTKFGSTDDSRLYIGQYLEPTADSTPPTATITSPASGTTLFPGSTLSITVDAHDDVAVAAVNFLVNGRVVFTSTSAPYQFNLTVPLGATSLTLGATAIDVAGNTGSAPDVTVDVIAVPTTTAVGTVVDQNNNPISGASVVCLGTSGTSGQSGAFSIAGIFVNQGNIQCFASFTSTNGSVLSGYSLSVPPVANGNTIVGAIVLLPVQLLVAPGAIQGGGLNSVRFLQTVPLSIESTLNFPCSPTPCNLGITDVAVSPDGTTAAVSVANEGQIAFLDLTVKPPAIIGSFSVPGSTASKLAFTPDGKFLVTTGAPFFTQHIASFNVATKKVVSTLSLPNYAMGFTITPANEILVASVPTNFSASLVSVLNISATGVLTNTGNVIQVGTNADDVAVSPNGQMALVANPRSNNLSVLNITSGTVSAAGTVALANFSPESVAFLPNGTGAAALSCGTSAQLAILEITSAGSVIDSGARIALGSVNCTSGIPLMVALPGSVQFAVHTSFGVSIVNAITNQVDSSITFSDVTGPSADGIAVIP
jgi:WD40 repeat protein